MSKVLETEIEKLFEATKDLKSFEEIKPWCDRFNEWLTTQSYNTASLGTKLSQCGFYKKFKSLPLEQGRNADLIPKHDENGNVIGHELKHYVLSLCGLDKDGWKQRNETTRVIDRLGNDQEVDPDKYLEVTGQLLESEDPHELAVGLIASTGRRPHEILARAKFSAIEGESYHVMFEGQGKKRGDQPVFKIATLYPADYIIKSLARLRREPGTKALLREVAVELSDDLAAQNRSIDNRRGQSLRRVVKEYFGDKYTETPALELRHDEDQNNCKALRAAYGAIATKRDCDRSVGSQMLHYAQLLGHFVDKNPTDRDLQAIATSMGYADYFVTKPVNFPPAPQKEKPESVRVLSSDFEIIKNFQLEWQLPNQQSVVTRLIQSENQKISTAKELIEAKSRISQLEKMVEELQQKNQQFQQEKLQMSSTENQQSQPQQIIINSSDLETHLTRLVDERFQLLLAKIPVQVEQHQQSEVVAIPLVEKSKSSPKELIDWEGKSNEDLWATKAGGASTEKIRRSYEAICAYNDTVATGDGDRLAITNQALRDLSGTNGLAVGEWIKNHADEIISHNSKHQMQNSKDPSKTETYYNKRHGQEKIQEILERINGKFLDGKALRSQQAKSAEV